MFDIDDKEIKRYEKDLKTFAKRAFPFATKATLNKSAFTARTFSQDEISDEMILRNRFTLQSIRVEQARTLDVSRQSSTVGSIATYMETQEFGGIKSKKGKKGVPIATSYSAGQGENAQPRTRLPRKANTIGNIQLSKKRRGKTRKQRMIFTVQDAVTTGRRMVFLDLGRTQGIFKVVGGSKKFKRGWPKGAKLKMIQDLSHETVTIKPTPWLAPSVKNTIKMMPEIYKEALIFQLKRQKIFIP